MYIVKEIFDMRGTMFEVGTFDDMDEVNGFLDSKHGYYTIESKENFVTISKSSKGREYEVLSFGKII